MDSLEELKKGENEMFQNVLEMGGDTMPEEDYDYEDAMNADYGKELDDRKEEAEEILADTKKIEKLIKKVRKLCTKLSRIPVIGSVIGEFGIVCDLISDYINGTYREIPAATILSFIAALVYLVSPFDIIPDVVPVLGFCDDAAALKFALDAARNDLYAYANWKYSE